MRPQLLLFLCYYWYGFPLFDYEEWEEFPYEVPEKVA